MNGKTTLTEAIELHFGPFGIDMDHVDHHPPSGWAMLISDEITRFAEIHMIVELYRLSDLEYFDGLYTPKPPSLLQQEVARALLDAGYSVSTKRVFSFEEEMGYETHSSWKYVQDTYRGAFHSTITCKSRFRW